MIRRGKFFACVLLLLSGLYPGRPLSAQEVYLVGGIEIRLYETREDLWRDLPAHVTATWAPLLKQMGDKIVFSGWTEITARRVYAIKDWCVVFHELKHALEPDWSHELDRTDACKEVRVK